MMQAHCIELFRTRQGIIWQDNRSVKLVVEWQGRESSFNFPSFVSLLRQAESISVEAMLDSQAADVEILKPCGCDRIFILSVHELLEFNELLQGARFGMNLNSMLHAQLYRAYQFA
jgi:hypothetical protein